nr:EAL domain-containing protein [Gammaproteobacteria bacterium]
IHLTRELKDVQLRERSLVVQLSAADAVAHIKETRAVLTILRQLRCATALVDFGEGHDFLGALGHLPLDFVKLDPALTAVLAQGDEKGDLKRIVETAAARGVRIVATGIEDAHALTGVWNSGIRYAQGAYIQEPAPDLSLELHDAAD